MFIMCKDKDSIVNLDGAPCIFIGSDYVTIKAIGTDGKSYSLGRYSGSPDAIIAFEALCRQLRNPSSNIIEVMTDDDVKAALSRKRTERERAANGKKTVRRGGS